MITPLTGRWRAPTQWCGAVLSFLLVEVMQQVNPALRQRLGRDGLIPGAQCLAEADKQRLRKRRHTPRQFCRVATIDAGGFDVDDPY